VLELWFILVVVGGLVFPSPAISLVV
jgi:hypothetical protein